MAEERKTADYLQSDNCYWDLSMASGPYEIVQIGDLIAKANYCCESHVQFAHEFTYIVSGSALFICDGEEVTVSGGDVIFNPQDSLHEIRYCRNSGTLRFQYVGFRMKEADTVVDHKLYTYLQNSKWSIAKASASVVSAFEDILSNRFAKDEFQKKVAEDALRKLIISAKRCFECAQPDSDSRTAGEMNMLLLKICTFIDTNCKDIKILKELPKTFGYSYSYLSSVFSKFFGMSLQSYLLMRRHDLECQMLAQGLSVTEIADQMGYGSIHSFSHAFRRYSGVSPREYALTLSEKKERGDKKP